MTAESTTTHPIADAIRARQDADRTYAYAHTAKRDARDHAAALCGEQNTEFQNGYLAGFDHTAAHHAAEMARVRGDNLAWAAIYNDKFTQHEQERDALRALVEKANAVTVNAQAGWDEALRKRDELLERVRELEALHVPALTDHERAGYVKALMRESEREACITQGEAERGELRERVRELEARPTSQPLMKETLQERVRGLEARVGTPAFTDADCIAQLVKSGHEARLVAVDNDGAMNAANTDKSTEYIYQAWKSFRTVLLAPCEP